MSISGDPLRVSERTAIATLQDAIAIQQAIHAAAEAEYEAQQHRADNQEAKDAVAFQRELEEIALRVRHKSSSRIWGTAAALVAATAFVAVSSCCTVLSQVQIVIVKNEDDKNVEPKKKEAGADGKKDPPKKNQGGGVLNQKPLVNIEAFQIIDEKQDVDDVDVWLKRMPWADGIEPPRQQPIVDDPAKIRVVDPPKKDTKKPAPMKKAS